MVTQDDARLIDEYNRLREKLFELEALATAIDHRLVEIERQLPDDYPTAMNRLPRHPEL